ncbi:cobyrinate a,c-diamide synthase [Mobilibacterium timonense]|uniref:cobyrinate a,c-diamide synthase n=1 Tax=Mobilibacterium timonense TaxID=1871012 RepID=UPI003A952590
MNDRVMIAGTNSGCGKTTLTTAILALLKEKGLPGGISAFKCGPDYIDPMFHRSVLGVPSHNLDPFFSTPEQMRDQLDRSSGTSVIEGVMGYYDGIGTEGRCSSWTVASATGTPVIVVINGRGMYTSAAAVIKGFIGFRESSMIRGVIFNNVNEMVYRGLAEIAREAGTEPLGFLPHDPDITIGSRHLGLITAEEISDLDRRIRHLRETASQTLDVEGILRIAGTARKHGNTDHMDGKPPGSRSLREKKNCFSKPVIAVARDEAFSFIYSETIEAFEDHGGEIVYFSPVHDKGIPQEASAIYLPGGYPELYLKELSGNQSMLRSVREKAVSGMPVIAECGGSLYLHESVDGVPLAGIVAGEAVKTDRLQNFGYITLTAGEDSLLLEKGNSLPAHEFHYYRSTSNGDSFVARKVSNGRTYTCAHGSTSVYAGFPHLYLASAPEAVERFISRAREYGNSKRGNENE